jgi:hypothetical protein
MIMNRKHDSAWEDVDKSSTFTSACKTWKFSKYNAVTFANQLVMLLHSKATCLIGWLQMLQEHERHKRCVYKEAVFQQVSGNV